MHKRDTLVGIRSLAAIPRELLHEAAHSLLPLLNTVASTHTIILQLPDGTRARVTFQKAYVIDHDTRQFHWMPCLAEILPHG